MTKSSIKFGTLSKIPSLFEALAGNCDQICKEYIVISGRNSYSVYFPLGLNLVTTLSNSTQHLPKKYPCSKNSHTLHQHLLKAKLRKTFSKPLNASCPLWSLGLKRPVPLSGLSLQKRSATTMPSYLSMWKDADWF